MRTGLGVLLLVACNLAVAAEATSPKRPDGSDYHLAPIAVESGVYVIPGRSEGFTRDNGGNIVNTAFLVGTRGVIVIDTGPSRAYGEQQRAAITRISGLPIEAVYNTHAHPDHFLGNQAYPAERIAALPATITEIQRNGESLSANLFRLLGGWMAETRVVVPGKPVTQAMELRDGGRQILLMPGAGHTDGDLMVFDVGSRTLFTGDLVFHDRAATTPNADIERWLAQLDAIDRINYLTLVPGHGSIVHDRKAVAQTRDYLRWLAETLRGAAARGLDMQEAMREPIPERFRGLALVETEYGRSVSHLYPRYELDALPPAKP